MSDNEQRKIRKIIKMMKNGKEVKPFFPKKLGTPKPESDYKISDVFMNMPWSDALDDREFVCSIQNLRCYYYGREPLTGTPISKCCIGIKFEVTPQEEERIQHGETIFRTILKSKKQLMFNKDLCDINISHQYSPINYIQDLKLDEDMDFTELVIRDGKDFKITLKLNAVTKENPQSYIGKTRYTSFELCILDKKLNKTYQHKILEYDTKNNSTEEEDGSWYSISDGDITITV